MKTFCLQSYRPVMGSSRRLGWSVIVGSLLLSGNFLSAQTPTLVLSNKWTIAPTARFYLPASVAGDPRDVAINKITGNVLFPSLAGGSNTVRVVSGADGSDLGALNSLVLIGGGGTKHICQVAVADDGVIYACNLDLNQNFRIYRWSAEDTSGTLEPTLAYAGTLTGVNVRYGDSFNVRGAGTNTQIIASGTGTSAYGIWTTTDGTNFTGQVFTSPIGAGFMSRGFSFDGTNNAFYTDRDNRNFYHRIGFSLSPSNSFLIASNTLPSAVGMLTVAQSNGVTMLAGVADAGGASHSLKVFDITVPATASTAVNGDTAFPSGGAANGNITGGTDIGAGMIVGFCTHNGVVAQTIHFITNAAPAITLEPVNTAIIETGTASFTVDASGTAPLSVQWYFNDTNVIANATNKTLTLTNVQLSAAGLYRAYITNAIPPAVTSTNATLTVIPGTLTQFQAPLWSLPPGSRPYLTTDFTTRGLAYNLLSKNLLSVNRTTTNVYILNSTNGNDVGTLDMTGVGRQFAGGLFDVNLVGVGDDGAVYVCNLSQPNGAEFALYRWQNDTSDPTNTATYAYTGDPGVGRIGDSMAVRGAGTNTQILLGTFTNISAVLFTTTDGLNFNPTIIDLSIDPTVPAGFSSLGVAFGAGDTFWAKNFFGFSLRHVAFDLVSSAHSVLGAYTGLGQVGGIGADPANELLAGVAIESPDNLRLFDTSDLVNQGARLIDQDFFAADNPNTQGNGAVAFDVAGGRIFALGVNNGLLALKYAGRLKVEQPGNMQVVTWPVAAATLQSSTNVIGTYVDVSGATSPYTNNAASTLYFRLKR